MKRETGLSLYCTEICLLNSPGIPGKYTGKRPAGGFPGFFPHVNLFLRDKKIDFSRKEIHFDQVPVLDKCYRSANRCFRCNVADTGSPGPPENLPSVMRTTFLYPRPMSADVGESISAIRVRRGDLRSG